MELINSSTFIRQLKELTQRFESQSYSEVEVQRFFTLIESRNSLPQECSPEDVEILLTSFIFLVASRNGNNFVRAIKGLLQYLRNDRSVFIGFKPNPQLLRRLNLEKLILSSQPSESQTALELASFILRYHEELDYNDFTDNSVAIKKLRRYENVKYASEVEELAKVIEDLRYHQEAGNSSKSTRSTRSNSRQQDSRDKSEVDMSQLRLHLNKQIDAYKQIIDSEIEHKVNLALKSQAQFGLESRDPSMKANQYNKILELLLDFERKTDVKFKDTHAMVKDSVQKVISDVAKKDKMTEQIQNKVLDLDVDFKEKLTIFGNQFNSIKAQNDASQSIIVDATLKIEKMQNTMQDYVELVEAIDEKVGLANELINQTRKNFSQKLSQLESKIIEKLNQTDIHVQFKAYEDTIGQIEGELDNLRADFIAARDKTSNQAKECLDSVIQFQRDYGQRVMEIYGEITNTVKIQTQNFNKFQAQTNEKILNANNKVRQFKDNLYDLGEQVSQYQKGTDKIMENLDRLGKTDLDLGERIMKINMMQVKKSTPQASQASNKQFEDEIVSQVDQLRSLIQYVQQSTQGDQSQKVQDLFESKFKDLISEIQNIKNQVKIFQNQLESTEQKLFNKLQVLTDQIETSQIVNKQMQQREDIFNQSIVELHDILQRKRDNIQ